MVLKEFLQDLETTVQFLAETAFVDMVAECATIAQNAKSTLDSGWTAQLEAQLDKIDTAILNFETKHAAILAENQYLSEAAQGPIILNYRTVIVEIFGDILTADKEIAALVEKLTVFKTHTEQIFNALGVVEIEVPKRVEHTESLVSFSFNDLSDINTMTEFRTVGHFLNMHLKSLAKLDPSAPIGDIELATVSKASPFKIGAWLNKTVAGAINTIVSGVLDNYKKVQEIQIMNEKVKQAKLDTDSQKIDLALKETRAELEQTLVQRITDGLMEQYPQDGANGTVHEVREGVSRAVAYFSLQTSKGMEVKVLPPASEIKAQATGKAAVQDYVKQQIEAQKIIKQIPALSSNESEENQEEVSDEEVLENGDEE